MQNSAHHQISLFRKLLEADGRKLDELTRNIGKLEADLAVERSKVAHTEESWRQRESALVEAQTKAAKQAVSLAKAEDKVKAKEKTLEESAKAREKKVQNNGNELPAELDMVCDRRRIVLAWLIYCTANEDAQVLDVQA